MQYFFVVFRIIKTIMYCRIVGSSGTSSWRVRLLNFLNINYDASKFRCYINLIFLWTISENKLLNIEFSVSSTKSTQLVMPFNCTLCLILKLTPRFFSTRSITTGLNLELNTSIKFSELAVPRQLITHLCGPYG